VLKIVVETREGKKGFHPIYVYSYILIISSLVFTGAAF
jgi:hypothetical protein